MDGIPMRWDYPCHTDWPRGQPAFFTVDNLSFPEGLRTEGGLTTPSVPAPASSVSRVVLRPLLYSCLTCNSTAFTVTTNNTTNNVVRFRLLLKIIVFFLIMMQDVTNVLHKNTSLYRVDVHPQLLVLTYQITRYYDVGLWKRAGSARNEKQKEHLNSAPVQRRPCMCTNDFTRCGSSVLVYLANSDKLLHIRQHRLPIRFKATGSTQFTDCSLLSVQRDTHWTAQPVSVRAQFLFLIVRSSWEFLRL
jgi:hypothetical protein